MTIHCTYPEKTPVFEVCDVTPHANISIVSMKAVENQVMHHVMLDPQQCISILAYQLMKLLVCRCQVCDICGYSNPI